MPIYSNFVIWCIMASYWWWWGFQCIVRLSTALLWQIWSWFLKLISRPQTWSRPVGHLPCRLYLHQVFDGWMDEYVDTWIQLTPSAPCPLAMSATPTRREWCGAVCRGMWTWPTDITSPSAGKAEGVVLPRLLFWICFCFSNTMDLVQQVAITILHGFFLLQMLQLKVD